MRSLGLMLLCALVLLLPATIVSAYPMDLGPCQVEEGALVAGSYSGMMRVYEINRSNDALALQRLLADKKALRWPAARIPVYVDEGLAGLVKIRPQGTTETLWTLYAWVTCPKS
jgi:hypothetical protein